MCISLYNVINLFRVRWQLSGMSVPDGKIIQALQRYVFLFVLDFSLASHASDLMRSFIDEWHLLKYFTI